MKKFKFKLESVKRLRESEEKKKLDDYAKAMQRRHGQEQKIEKLQRDLAQSEDDIMARRRSIFSAADLHADRNATLAIRMQLETAQKDLEEALGEEDNHRAAFLGAKSNREIIDRLELKQREAFENDMRKIEEQEIEDVVVPRYSKSEHNSLFQ